MGRIISLIVVAGYILFAYLSGGTPLVLKILGFLIIGLACVWFGDGMGSLTGFSLIRMINISEETPGIVVRFLGWLILILVPGVICAVWITQ